VLQTIITLVAIRKRIFFATFFMHNTPGLFVARSVHCLAATNGNIKKLDLCFVCASRYAETSRFNDLAILQNNHC